MSTINDSKILLTKEAIKELKEELKTLIEVKRPEVIQEIVDARAQGDLSENAEYEAAREKQGLIEDRIAEIEKTLENAQEIKTSKKDIISIGSVVTIKNKFSIIIQCALDTMVTIFIISNRIFIIIVTFYRMYSFYPFWGFDNIISIHPIYYYSYRS